MQSDVSWHLMSAGQGGVQNNKMDEHLSWNKRVEIICHKISKRLGLLSRIQPNLTQKAAKCVLLLLLLLLFFIERYLQWQINSALQLM